MRLSNFRKEKKTEQSLYFLFFFPATAFVFFLTQLTIINYNVVFYLGDILDTFVNNIFFFSHGKNDFAKVFPNFTRYRHKKNNLVRPLK